MTESKKEEVIKKNAITNIDLLSSLIRISIIYIYSQSKIVKSLRILPGRRKKKSEIIKV